MIPSNETVLLRLSLVDIFPMCFYLGLYSGQQMPRTCFIMQRLETPRVASGNIKQLHELTRLVHDLLPKFFWPRSKYLLNNYLILMQFISLKMMTTLLSKKCS